MVRKKNKRQRKKKEKETKWSRLTIIEIHLHEGHESSERKKPSGKQGCATLTRVCHWPVEFLERQQFGFITVVHDCTHLFEPGGFATTKNKEAELVSFSCTVQKKAQNHSCSSC